MNRSSPPATIRTSGLYISVIPPVLVGLLARFLPAIMGVGGGFIMVLAMCAKLALGLVPEPHELYSIA